MEVLSCRRCSRMTCQHMPAILNKMQRPVWAFAGEKSESVRALSCVPVDSCTSLSLSLDGCMCRTADDQIHRPRLGFGLRWIGGWMLFYPAVVRYRGGRSICCGCHFHQNSFVAVKSNQWTPLCASIIHNLIIWWWIRAPFLLCATACGQCRNSGLLDSALRSRYRCFLIHWEHQSSKGEGSCGVVQV